LEDKMKFGEMIGKTTAIVKDASVRAYKAVQGLENSKAGVAVHSFTQITYRAFWEGYVKEQEKLPEHRRDFGFPARKAEVESWKNEVASPVGE
jgi:hypothetical protein